MKGWPIALLLSIAATASAQQTPPPEPQLPSLEPPSLKPADPDPPSLASQLTFGRDGPRMTVPVTIAGAGPYDFIVDTGAQRTVISRELAATLGLRHGARVRMTAMSGSSEVGTVTIPSISVSARLPGIGARRIDAPALEAQHLGAPGMLGIDTLQNHAVAIDFDAQTMAVTPSTRRAARRPAASDEIVIEAKSLFGQLVVTEAFVGTHRIRVILDTGSVVSLGNSALRARLRKSTTAPIELVSVTGGLTTADYGTIDTIRLGGLTIDALPIAFADVAPFREFGLEKRPAILLGMDALRLFRRVDIDFANRQLRLLAPRGTLRRG